MTDSEAYVRIGEFIESHQSDRYSDIGKQLGLSRHQVARIARLRGIKRGPGKRSAALQAAVALIDAAMARPGSVSANEPNQPVQEPIFVAPEAPPVEEALPTTPEAPPA